MKRRATVIDVSDPEDYGRIRARVHGFGDDHNETPWCWPCSALAGPSYGFFCLPQVGDEVWVEQTAEKDWVWTGFFWSGRHPKPADGAAPDVRVFRTPGGHQVKFDEAGNVEIVHGKGATIVLKPNGDIELNGSLGNVVRTCDICAYTGAPHVKGSSTVKAGG